MRANKNDKQCFYRIDFQRWMLTLFFLSISLSVLAISRKERDSLLNLPLFKEESLLQIQLKTDLSALLNDIGEKRKYHKSKMLVTTEGKQNIDSFEIQVKTRGNFRRQKQNCNFPPLRFKFPVENTLGTVFEGQSKLKYVSHCQSFIEGYERHTLEEYLIYKMYNLISNHSYRVRLAQILFVDTVNSDSIKRFGFFLEDTKDVATRNGKKIMHYKNMKQNDMLRQEMVMLCLFQLMIGNADWSVERLHNIDIMSVSEHSIPVAVPYDFDWSGIINHAYYTPDPKIESGAKYQRIYKGYKWSLEEFNTAFSRYNDLKESFMQLIADFPYFEEENRLKMQNYILKFYELINSPKDIHTVLEESSSGNLPVR